MADFNVPFAFNAQRRTATTLEKENGFPCGPADVRLFNGLFHQLQNELKAIHVEAGIVGDDTTNTTTLDAILALISAAVGDSPAGYILETQALTTLLIYPEVQTTDGKMGVTSTGAGNVRVPGGVSFLRRGIKSYTTAQTDFVTTASKTYHVRWNAVDGLSLKDLSDIGYNPGGLAESNVAFDSTYDDMLIARVTTNSSNLPTITNLVNKNRLGIAATLTGTSITDVTADVSKANISGIFDWARSPTSFSLNLVHRVSAKQDKLHMHKNVRPLGASNTDLMSLPPLFDVDRYRIQQTVADVYFTAIRFVFSASA